MFKALYDRVDVRREYLHPAFIDLVALAAPQHQSPPVIQYANVSRHEPAVSYDLCSQVIAPKIAFHQGGRIQPNIPWFTNFTLGICIEHACRVRLMQHLDDRPPTFADQPVFRRTRRIDEPGHPAAGFGDAIGVTDLLHSGPPADTFPNMG